MEGSKGESLGQKQHVVFIHCNSKNSINMEGHVVWPAPFSTAVICCEAASPPYSPPSAPATLVRDGFVSIATISIFDCLRVIDRSMWLF